MDAFKALLIGTVMTQWASQSYTATGTNTYTRCYAPPSPCSPIPFNDPVSATYTAYALPSHVKATAQWWNAQNSLTMNFNALLPPAPAAGGCPSYLSQAGDILGVLSTASDVAPLGLLGGVLSAICDFV